MKTTTTTARLLQPGDTIIHRGVITQWYEVQAVYQKVTYEPVGPSETQLRTVGSIVAELTNGDRIYYSPKDRVGVQRAQSTV